MTEKRHETAKFAEKFAHMTYLPIEYVPTEHYNIKYSI